MEILNFMLDDKYDRKCGDVFLTVKGNMIFHCILCENKYEGYQEYSLHTVKEHYESEILDPIDLMVISDVNATSDIADAEGTDVIGNKEIKLKSSTLSHSKKNELNQTNLNCIEKYESSYLTPHRCQQCGSSFKHYTNLLGHMKRHSTRKPHKCTFCPKSFYTRSELRRHTRRHTGERPFLCSDCGQKFITSSELAAHSQRHTNLRNKQCSICEMKFFNNFQLKEHMAVHSEHRPHKCSTCNASFKLIKTLRSHLKIHENKRDYQCELCSARFNQKPGLHSHMKSGVELNAIPKFMDASTINWLPGAYTEKFKWRNTHIVLE